jgi:TetR/AcrR family transcriptional regulator, transcriptional repressor for nem operon
MSVKKPRTRNLEITRKVILDASFWEIYTRGFQGVSVDDIVKKTNLTKGAFYHHFPTKLELGYALVEEVIRPMILSRWIEPLSEFSNPLEGVLSLLQLHIGDQLPEALNYGCPLNNLVQEMASIDHDFKVKLETSLELWIQQLAVHLESAQANGNVTREVSAIEIAEFIVMCHEGFFGLIKGNGRGDIFKSLLKSLKIYFRSIQILPYGALP